MMNECLKLFNLSEGVSVADIKKAYRKLAKINHPDRFADVEEKAKQERIMAEINKAYQTLIAYSKQPKADKPSDYGIYKQGINYFNEYSGSGVDRKHIDTIDYDALKVDPDVLKRKYDLLTQAKACFKRILAEYPDSDWSFDSEQRVKKIEKIIENIDAARKLHK